MYCVLVMVVFKVQRGGGGRGYWVLCHMGARHRDRMGVSHCSRFSFYCEV